MVNLNDICIPEDISCQQVLETLNKQGSRILFVTNNNKELLGTITDGDIRRGLISGLNLDDKCLQFMNKEPIFHEAKMPLEDSLALMKSHDLIAIPLLDTNKRVIDIRFLNQIEVKEERNESVIIMAGGFGKRLKELTKEKPKPMIIVNGKPIMEHLLLNLISQGFRDFKISVHYLSNQIKDYFGDGELFGVNIEYLEEREPLGTAGCLFLAKEKNISSNFILLNGDLMTHVDYSELIETHRKDNNFLTVGTKIFESSVSFGVIKSKGSLIKEIQEKPSFFHEVSGGIYVLKKSVLERFKQQENIDMPQLIENLITSKKRVGRFPIIEYWRDLGTKEDLEEVAKDIKSV